MTYNESLHRVNDYLNAIEKQNMDSSLTYADEVHVFNGYELRRSDIQKLIEGQLNKIIDGTCVFCRIIQGKEPADVVANGILNIAITPLNPVVDGHFIVIPKTHVSDAYADDKVTGNAMADASLWAKLMSDRDERYSSVNFITSVGKPATQSVFHLYIHVVPRKENDKLKLPWSDQNK